MGEGKTDARMMRRSVTWLWIWIGWTGLALFLGVSSSLAYISVGNPPRWSLTIRMSLVEMYGWAVMAPVVMALARRFPFTRATLVRSLAVHVPASLAASTLKLIVDQILRRVLFGFRGYLLFTSLAPNVLFYWGIVAAAHGFAYPIKPGQGGARVAARGTSGRNTPPAPPDATPSPLFVQHASHRVGARP